MIRPSSRIWIGYTNIGLKHTHKMVEQMNEQEAKEIDPEILKKFRGFTAEIDHYVGAFYDAMILNNTQDLYALRYKLNADLKDMLDRHNREMDWLTGKPVKPIVHFAEAIVTGVGG